MPLLQRLAKTGIKPSIQKSLFGEIEGTRVYQYTLTNSKGMIVKLITYGASITDIVTPDRDGELGSVVLGFDSLSSYTGRQNALLGATVGRVANRIAKGKFMIENKEYQLSSNIHGGVQGFHKKIWTAQELPGRNEVAVKMTYLSKDSEEGYPGNLHVTVTYTLTNKNELKITYLATTDKATPVVLTNHSYFNLSGGKTENILHTELRILADKYLEADKDLIPTGNLLDVKGTAFDFTQAEAIGQRISEAARRSSGGGYDLTFALRNQSGKLALAAVAYDPSSNRLMQVYTTEPGLVFYSGNHLNQRIMGRGGKAFAKHGAFCLETQHFPDSPNQPSFPDVILRPGKVFRSQTIYAFSVRK